MNYYPNTTPLTGGQFNFSSYPMGQTPVSQQNQMATPNPSFLPSPTGNVYSINNSYEVVNIPAGLGTSAALCMNENVLYLKTMQNGAPVLLGYKLTPLSPVDKDEMKMEKENEEKDFDKYGAELKFYDNKFKFIEDEINKIKEKLGGMEQCQF